MAMTAKGEEPTATPSTSSTDEVPHGHHPTLHSVLQEHGVTATVVDRPHWSIPQMARVPQLIVSPALDMAMSGSTLRRRFAGTKGQLLGHLTSCFNDTGRVIEGVRLLQEDRGDSSFQYQFPKMWVKLISLHLNTSTVDFVMHVQDQRHVLSHSFLQ